MELIGRREDSFDRCSCDRSCAASSSALDIIEEHTSLGARVELHSTKQYVKILLRVVHFTVYETIALSDGNVLL